MIARCRLVKRFFWSTTNIRFARVPPTPRNETVTVPHFYGRVDPFGSSLLCRARDHLFSTFFRIQHIPPLYTYYAARFLPFSSTTYSIPITHVPNNKRSNFLPPHHKPVSFLRRFNIRASVTPRRFSTTVHST